MGITCQVYFPIYYHRMIFNIRHSAPTSSTRRWRDLAELIENRSMSCAILGMAGATVEAVECLRKSFEEPSYALPFLDPYYPHYDLIRDEPEFVELVAEVDKVI